MTQQPVPLLSSHQVKILLVDEEAGDLQHYRFLLEALGYEVYPCVSYAEGSRWLEREKYDLAIVSQGGDRFEWRSLLERAAEEDRGMPVLVLTPRYDLVYHFEAMQLGAVGYLQKPLSVPQLVEVVEVHLFCSASASYLCGAADWFLQTCRDPDREIDRLTV